MWHYSVSYVWGHQLYQSGQHKFSPNLRSVNIQKSFHVVSSAFKRYVPPFGMDVKQEPNNKSQQTPVWITEPPLLHVIASDSKKIEEDDRARQDLMPLRKILNQMMDCELFVKFDRYDR